MPQFEVFRKRTVPLVKQPYVTIQKRGVFSLNKAAHAALGEPRAIELLYDPTEKIVGIRSAEETVEHAYMLRSSLAKRESSLLVSGRAFTQYYGINTDISRRWPAYVEDGILCIDLKQAGTEVIGNRTGKGRNGTAETNGHAPQELRSVASDRIADGGDPDS